jgi:flap endonuclease-1
MNLFGVPCLIAQSEAESLCAILCKKGIVDAIISEDMDVLATGGKILLKNFSMEKGGNVMEVCLEGVLNELELSQNEFLDMCILCGCDYTSKIGGIGPMHAYKLMKTYKSIENAMDHIKKSKSYKVPNDFDYVTSRNLFNNACINDDFESYKNEVLQSPIKVNELLKFLGEKTKMKGKILTEIEELGKCYKNEKKMNEKIDESNPNDVSMLNKMTYQPTLHNYFSIIKK